MHNYSSCPIYQTNNINPPKKRHPLKLEREREREVLLVEKEEGEEEEEGLEGSSET